MSPAEFRSVRDGLGLSQVDLAQALGITRQTVSGMENGRIAIDTRTEYAMRWIEYKGVPSI